MPDNFTHIPRDRDDPADSAAVVAPNDASDLAEVPNALYIGTGGDVAVQGSRGNTTTFRNVPSGSILPFRARRVMLTGTTASNILALY